MVRVMGCFLLVSGIFLKLAFDFFSKTTVCQEEF